MNVNFAAWSLLETLPCLMIIHELFCCYNVDSVDALWNIHLKYLFISMCLKPFHGAVRELPRGIKDLKHQSTLTNRHSKGCYKLEKLLCEGAGQFCPHFCFALSNFFLWWLFTFIHYSCSLYFLHWKNTLLKRCKFCLYYCCLMWSNLNNYIIAIPLVNPKSL